MRTQPRHRATRRDARTPSARRAIAVWTAFWLAVIAVVAVAAVPAQASEPVANDDTATTVVNTAVFVSVLDNDADPDDEPIQVTGASQPANGTVECTAGGICTYDPAPGFIGSDTFTYTVSDGTENASADVSITVTPGVSGNRGPIAVDDESTADSGAWAFLYLLDNDSDPDGDALQINSATTPDHGTIECSAQVYCVYTSDIGYSGPDAFTYVVADKRGGTDVGAVSLTVAPNQDPLAADDDLTTRAGANARSVDVIANDADPDGDVLTASLLTDPEHGTATCGNRLCRYTPAAGYVGPDAFAYTASDGRGGTDSATVHVEVTANRPPEPVGDTVAAVQGVVVALELLNNDSDPDGDRLTLTGTTDPEHGELSCDPNGFCDYTADDDYAGDDSFEYDVTDGTDSATATATITVTPPCPPARCIDNGTIGLAVHPEGHLNVPDGSGSFAGPGSVGLMFRPTGNDATAPGCLCEGWGVADADSGVTGYVSEETDQGASGMTVEDFDVTASTARSVVDIADAMRVTHDFHPSARTPNLYQVDVTIQNLSGAAIGDLRYRRVTDWDVEPTSFSEYVTIQGGHAQDLLFDSDHGFATANPLGERPSILATGDFVDSGPVDHGALLDFGFGGLAAGATKTFTLYYGAAADEVGAERALNAVGAEVYSLAQPDTEDGPTLGTPNTFMVAFTGVGGSPAFSPDAVDDSLTTEQGRAGSLDVLANDTDPNDDVLRVSTPSPSAEHGDVACTEAGVCTYNPDPAYSGADSFQYEVDDGNGGSDTAEVTVDVVPVDPGNTDPRANDDTLVTEAGVVGSVDVLANDSDPDGDMLSVTTPNPDAQHGDVDCTADGLCRYTPEDGFSGADSFEYMVTDGEGGSDGARVAIDVVAAPGQLDLSLSQDAATAQYSDAVGPITAVVTGGASPGPPTVEAVGLPASLALSDHGDGTAEIAGVLTVGRGQYPASVAAVQGAESVSRALAVEVTRESADVTYSGERESEVPDGETETGVALAAEVRQDDDGTPGEITRARVYFDLYAGDDPDPAGSPERTVGPVAPSDAGVAATTVDLPAGAWTVVARFDQSNDYFTGPAAPPAELVVDATPSVEPGRAYGCGRTEDSSGRGHHHHWWSGHHQHWWKGKGHHHPHHHHHRNELDAGGSFCVDWSRSADGAVKGSTTYVFRGADGHRYLLEGARPGRLTFGLDGDVASAMAKGFGNLSELDGPQRHGHHWKHGERIGRVWFRVDVTDGRTSTADRFAISIRQGGVLLHQVGRPGQPRPIENGRIVVG